MAERLIRLWVDTNMRLAGRTYFLERFESQAEKFGSAIGNHQGF